MSNFASFFVTFDQHEMTIIEVDGVYTVAKVTDLIYLSNAQRMSVLITAKPKASENFAFVGAMDPTMFDSVPSTLDLNATGYLVYDTAKPLPTVAPSFGSYDGGLALDDFGLVPYDKLALFEPVTRQVVFNVNSGVTDNQNRLIPSYLIGLRRCITDLRSQVYHQQHHVHGTESAQPLHSLKRGR